MLAILSIHSLFFPGGSTSSFLVMSVFTWRRVNTYILFSGLSSGKEGEGNRVISSYKILELE